VRPSRRSRDVCRGGRGPWRHLSKLSSSSPGRPLHQDHSPGSTRVYFIQVTRPSSLTCPGDLSFPQRSPPEPECFGRPGVGGRAQEFRSDGGRPRFQKTPTQDDGRFSVSLADRFDCPADAHQLGSESTFRPTGKAGHRRQDPSAGAASRARPTAHEHQGRAVNTARETKHTRRIWTTSRRDGDVTGTTSPRTTASDRRRQG